MSRTSLDEIAWEELFETFEENRPALPCQDKTPARVESRLVKLVKRD